MSIQPKRPYLQVLSETLARLEADPVQTSQMADLKRILRDRIASIGSAPEQPCSDSLVRQFHSDL